MKLTFGEKQIEIFSSGKCKQLIILNAGEMNGSKLWELCQNTNCKDMALAVISGIDWNLDLSPWKAPAVFKKGEAFLGGANTYFVELTQTMIPSMIKALPQEPEEIILGGYSLAGLFATYAAYQGDFFQGVLSVSGSLWYPDFFKFIKSHDISHSVQRAYFSVGAQEAKTKNHILQTVEENTKLISDYLHEQGIETTFEKNSGGHFVDVEKRLVKAITWINKSANFVD